MRLEVAAIRGHGEGTLFRRRTGQWVSAVTMRDGRRASRTTHSRDAAKAALAELLRLRDAGAPITGRIRLGDFLERWVSDDHDLAPATRRKHESIIRIHLDPLLGHIRLSELSPQDVSRALVSLGRLDPQTVRHVRATLRRCLADAIRQGLVNRNVAALARSPRIPHRERTILDATQARTLIESTRGTRYGPLWTILVTTGLRISEALGLAWSDVDMGGNDGRSSTDVHVGRPETAGPADEHERRLLRGGRDGVSRTGPSLTVRHQLAREDGEWVRRQPKTAKGRRTIPLTSLGVDALRAQREQQREWLAASFGGDDGRVGQRSDGGRLRDGGVGLGQSRGDVRRMAPAPVTPFDGLVFTTERGRPIHGENLLPKLRADLAAAGLPKVGCHDLRHTAATLLYSMGIPMPAIADILGHADARITEQLYRHHVKAFSVEAAKRMQEALG